MFSFTKKTTTREKPEKLNKYVKVGFPFAVSPLFETSIERIKSGSSRLKENLRIK